MIRSEPLIQVGIIEHARTVRGNLAHSGKLQDKSIPAGEFSATVKNGNVRFSIGGKEIAAEHSLTISDCGNFTLHGVVIGKGFHWERTEAQTFHGSLKLIDDSGTLAAVNEIGLEEYLESVISSEMSAESPVELLKAHAVTSRSWLAAMLEKQKKAKNLGGAVRHAVTTDDTMIRWYDREDHALFDVCADDHCQRYQGVSRIISDAARSAVRDTRGLFLAHDDAVCDARFSKACGGISERFSTAWEDSDIPYLDSIPDAPVRYAPLADEQDLRSWILSPPVDAYCNTSDGSILRKVLPSYDQETSDFFRWAVRYKSEELNELVRKKSGIDFGEIVDLIPVERGPSGRLVRLKIVGSKKTVTVGKELEIRKWFSVSHLYSSAFCIDVERDASGKPTRWVLRGAGWGHGVGLCQIGAAVMAMKGKSAEEIVKHYFRKAELMKLY